MPEQAPMLEQPPAAYQEVPVPQVQPETAVSPTAEANSYYTQYPGASNYMAYNTQPYGMNPYGMNPSSVMTQPGAAGPGYVV